MINVVGKADSGDNGICQNPQLASSLENNFAPVNWANTCSTTGRMSLSTDTFIKSRQVHTNSHRTIGFLSYHHPSTPFSGFLDRRDHPQLHHPLKLCFNSRQEWYGNSPIIGVIKAKGHAPSLGQIVYSPFNFPSPLNRLGNCTGI